MLWTYAKDKLDWPLGDNPAAKIDLYGTNRQYEPWPDWMINQLQSAPDVVLVVAELILGTGQRPSAAIAMRHDDFDGDQMSVLDEKNDERIEVYCPDRLRRFVASIRKTERVNDFESLQDPSPSTDCANSLSFNWPRQVAVAQRYRP